MSIEDTITELGAEKSVLREFSIKALYVFGSVARGEDRPDSDGDILVDFEPDAQVGLFTFGRLQRRLSQILGRPVDLVTPDALHPALKDRVLEEDVRATQKLKFPHTGYLGCGGGRAKLHGWDDLRNIHLDRRTVEAVVRNFIVIGEAAIHIPDEICARNPEILWPDMRAVRNFVMHEYFGVSERVLWDTIHEDLPGIVKPLRRLL